MSAFTDFLSDPQHFGIWLVEMTGYKLADGTTTVFRFSTAEYATEPTDSPANVLYSARVIKGFNLSADSIPPATVGILPRVQGGVVKLAQRFGDLDATFEDYAFEGRAITIKYGGTSRFGRLAYADFGVVFVGTVAKVKPGLAEVEITLRDAQSKLDNALEHRVYRGTGYCLDLAAGAYSDHGSPAKTALTGDLTIEGWFWFDALGTVENVFGWEGTGRPFQLRKSAADRLRLIDSGVVDILTSSASITGAGRWYHLAVSVTPTLAIFYTYDLQTGTETVQQVTGSGFSSRAAASSATLRLGASSNGLDGMIDDLRLWNYARSADDIRASRFRELTATEIADSRLVFYAKLNDGTGTGVADASASPAAGTITGTHAWYQSLTGHPDIVGTVLPNAFGKVFRAEPVPVDDARQIFQVHSREVDSIVQLYEGGGTGVAFNAAFTDWKTFMAATTPPETYDTLICPAGSFVRIGHQASKPITVDVQGDAYGSYVDTAGGVVRRFVTQFGSPENRLADPSDLDTSAFSDLDTSDSSTVGYFAREDITRTDLAAVILRSINAVGYFRRDNGRLSVRRNEGATGTPVLTLTERDVAGGKLEPVDVDLPIGSVRVAYAKCWRVHSDTEVVSLLAGTITSTQRSFVGHEWRFVDRPRQSTVDKYPSAGQLYVETALQEEADAVALAEFLLSLFDDKGRAFAAVCRSRGYQLDRFDVVSLEYQDLDALGQRQDRLGTAAGLDFLVLGFEQDEIAGETTLTLWRED
jgi:hypothetical protein